MALGKRAPSLSLSAENHDTRNSCRLFNLEQQLKSLQNEKDYHETLLKSMKEAIESLETIHQRKKIN